MTKKLSTTIMYQVTGLEGYPKNDKNLYMSLDQAEMHAPGYALIEKVVVLKIPYRKL